MPHTAQSKKKKKNSSLCGWFIKDNGTSPWLQTISSLKVFISSSFPSDSSGPDSAHNRYQKEPISYAQEAVQSHQTSPAKQLKHDYVCRSVVQIWQRWVRDIKNVSCLVSRKINSVMIVVLLTVIVYWLHVQGNHCELLNFTMSKLQKFGKRLGPPDWRHFKLHINIHWIMCHSWASWGFCKVASFIPHLRPSDSGLLLSPQGEYCPLLVHTVTASQTVSFECRCLASSVSKGQTSWQQSEPQLCLCTLSSHEATLKSLGNILKMYEAVYKACRMNHFCLWLALNREKKTKIWPLLLVCGPCPLVWMLLCLVPCSSSSSWSSASCLQLRKDAFPTQKLSPLTHIRHRSALEQCRLRLEAHHFSNTVPRKVRSALTWLLFSPGWTPPCNLHWADFSAAALCTAGLRTLGTDTSLKRKRKNTAE